MLRYALLGRTGSGRRFFQQLLEKNGFTIAKSYTTRERKNDNDNQHHFIENINDFADRVLETTHDGNLYFYTMSELENAEIIPIDPENIKALCELFPDDAFRSIEIVADNENRLTHAVANAEDKITAEEDFLAACEAENKAFCDMEDAMASKNFGFDNLIVGHIVNNDFTEDSDVFRWVDMLKSTRRAFKRMSTIIKEIADNQIIHQDSETGRYDLAVQDDNDPDGNPIWLHLSCDVFTESVLTDPMGISTIMESWLRLENISFKDD